MLHRTLIIHGYEGSNQGNWLPWLKKELESLGEIVDSPDFPNAGNPESEEWTSFFKNIWHPEMVPTEPTFRTIIGHSLGGTAVLRALELDWAQPVDLAILIASTSHKAHPPQLENFFNEPHDFRKIQKNCKKFILIFSDNDPYIPEETGPYLQHQLGDNASLFMLHDAKHFMARDGFKEFPLLLEMIKNQCSN